MINARPGEYFGLTGPLGNSFNIENMKNILLVGGGIGTAPLNFLAIYLTAKNKNVDVLFGARNSGHLDYCEPLTGIASCSMSFYTDDGSRGEKGFVTKDLEKILKRKKYDSVCICGPEIMMKTAVEMVKDKIENIQISMERYMKCGLGLCGSCVLDDIGLRVCEDGPVFDYNEVLKNCREFGNYHRDKNGIIEKI
jgi:dihydroorotate dehydrogenase electron transfer subunit